MSMLEKSKVFDAYYQIHENLHEIVNNKLGVLLTLCDAAFADARQCKAMKDMVKKEFNSLWNDNIRDGLVSEMKKLAKEVGDEWGESTGELACGPLQALNG